MTLDVEFIDDDDKMIFVLIIINYVVQFCHPLSTSVGKVGNVDNDDDSDVIGGNLKSGKTVRGVRFQNRVIVRVQEF